PAVVTCIRSPLRAEMKPSITGPAVISAARGGDVSDTVAVRSASGASWGWAARVPGAVPASAARRTRTLWLVGMTRIGLLLQTLPVGPASSQLLVRPPPP